MSFSWHLHDCPLLATEASRRLSLTALSRCPLMSLFLPCLLLTSEVHLLTTANSYKLVSWTCLVPPWNPNTQELEAGASGTWSHSPWDLGKSGLRASMRSSWIIFPVLPWQFSPVGPKNQYLTFLNFWMLLPKSNAPRGQCKGGRHPSTSQASRPEYDLRNSQLKDQGFSRCPDHTYVDAHKINT